MSVASFIPELWSAKIGQKYKSSLVFAQPSVANRDYQGEITAQGDTVHINAISAIAVRDYTRGGTITFDNVALASQDLVIDQAKYFAFLVNDVDKVQARGEYSSLALDEAAYSLKRAADSYAAGLFQPAALSANKVGRVKIVSGGTQIAGSGQITAYDLLVELGLKLNKQDAPRENRYVVVPPEFEAAIQKDDRFVRVDASGTSDTLRNGIFARAAGFDVLVSNNLAVAGGGGADKSDQVIVAGIPGAFTFADQILKTEAGRREAGFDDFVKGLNVYGAKVTRPEGIATATIQAFEPGTGATTVVTGA